MDQRYQSIDILSFCCPHSYTWAVFIIDDLDNVSGHIIFKSSYNLQVCIWIVYHLSCIVYLLYNEDRWCVWFLFYFLCFTLSLWCEDCGMDMDLGFGGWCIKTWFWTLRYVLEFSISETVISIHVMIILFDYGYGFRYWCIIGNPLLFICDVRLMISMMIVMISWCLADSYCGR